MTLAAPGQLTPSPAPLRAVPTALLGALAAAVALLLLRAATALNPAVTPALPLSAPLPPAVASALSAATAAARGVVAPVLSAALANPGAVALVLLLTALAEVALVATHRGSVPVALPWGRTAVVTFASAKLGALTPVQSGDLGLRLRFLHRHGLDRAGALRSMALRSAGTGAVNAGVAAVVLLAVGSRLASPTGALPVAVGVLVVLLVLAALLPRVAARVLREVRSLAADLVATLRTPRRARLLYGGAAVTLAARVLSLGLVLHVTGVGFAPEVALLALVVGAAGQGMVGAIGALTAEATLAAGLIATGVDPLVALQSAILFRALTYWGLLPAAAAALVTARHRRWV